jgi:hypothetical protein
MHPRSRTVRRTLGLVMLVVLALLVLGACSGVEKEAKPRPLPEEAKPLQPGEYRSEEFEPSLSFSVGKGWKNAPPESSEFLDLQRGALGDILFLRIEGVYEPTRVGVPDLVEAPEDAEGGIAWLRHHPYLRTSRPELVEVGGVEGERVDAIVGDLPEGHRGRCGTDCVDTARVEGVPPMKIPLAIFEKEKVRVIGLEVDGKAVYISISGPAVGFDLLIPEAQKVLDTVKWSGS